MALSQCMNREDEQGREMIEHGTALFPLACYYDDLTRDRVPWHWHEEVEALIVNRGSAISLADSMQIILEEGEGCLINGNVLHAQINLHPGEICRFHSMCFHPRLVGGSAESVFWSKYISPVIDNSAFKMISLKKENGVHGQILEWLEQAWQCCVNETPDYEIEARHALSLLIARTGELLPAGQKSVHLHDTIREERMKTMLQFIHHNLEGELKVIDIARAANVSESECLRSFRRLTGVPPMKYVQQLRMQKASEMLRNTDLSVSDIAAACGFGDLSYFTRVFRNNCKMTPSAYRKQD